MIPVIVDPKQVSIALVGRGRASERRLAQLLEGGALRLSVFSDRRAAGLAARAGARLHRRLPEAKELAAFALLWIVDLPLAEAAPLARAARAAGCLVNVEDVAALCDFHNPAQVRRGDLLLTVSTGVGVPASRRASGLSWGARLAPNGRSAWTGSRPGALCGAVPAARSTSSPG